LMIDWVLWKDWLWRSEVRSPTQRVGIRVEAVAKYRGLLEDVEAGTDMGKEEVVEEESEGANGVSPEVERRRGKAERGEVESRAG
jgi:hypothetical protein